MLDFFLNAFRIPPFLLPIYIAAGERYGVPWQVLAAINEVESDYGYNLTVSSAGAEGWMQFLPAEWLAYGVDANGATVRDPYNPADAIFAAARYLAYAGAAHDLGRAIYAYNHSSSYVESVVLRAQLIAAAPPALTSGLTAILAGRLPVGGSGAHPATPVWVTSPRARSARAGQGSGAPTAALAAPPSSAAGAGTSAKSVAGVELAASPGAPIVAVQRAEIVRVGHGRTLGRFIELRDAYGDTYTYGRLGQVLARAALVHAPASHPTGGSGRANRPGHADVAPLRKGTWVTAGTVLGSVPGASSPYASAGSGPGSAHFLFEIRPAGAGLIDPRPIVEAWQLLAETEGQPHPGTQPLFGAESGRALIGEIQLMSQRQLEAHLLSDSRFHSYGCERADIAGGRIGRPVLATLYLLVASGLDPTVSALRCTHGAEATPASLAEHARGDAVAITALDGVRIASHRGSSLAGPAVRVLVNLPPSVRPSRIITAVRPREAAGSTLQAGPPGRIDIDFRPATSAGAAAGSAPNQQAPTHQSEAPAQSSTSAASASSSAAPGSPPEPVLSTAQWDKLLAHTSQLPEPRVPRAPTRAALGDNATSPPPTAGPSSPPPRQAAAGTPSTETKVQNGAPVSYPLKPAQAGGHAPAGLAAPPAASGLAALAPPLEPTLVSPPVVLRTPQYPSATQPLHGSVELTAETSEPASAIKSMTFLWRPAEPPGGKWTEIETGQLSQNNGTTSASASFDTTTAVIGKEHDGLYDLGVRVTPNESQKPTESELPDRLIDNNETPVLGLAVGNKGSEYLRGEIKLEAKLAPNSPHVPPGTELKPLMFEYSPAGSGQWAKIATVEWEPKKGVVKQCFETLSKEAASAECPYLPPPDGRSNWDGRYDFRVVPEQSAPPPQEDTFLSIPVRDRLLDNTPPSVSLNNPGSSLQGRVTLEAQASDSGSGVEEVTLEYARPGSGDWKEIGKVTVPPYSHPLNTGALQEGDYELRATAVDRAGNSRTSEPVRVKVHSEQAPSPITASISGVVAPAHAITILGAVPASGGRESETWAYGFTSAPPSQGQDGSPLPYLAEGDQLVLLRYTGKGGWQIADVPRCPPGSTSTLCERNGAFKLLPANEVGPTTGGVRVSGAMAPSGEAWLWVAETSNGGESRVGLFHRAPNGQSASMEPAHFELDTQAMEKLDAQATQKGGETLLESLKSGGQLRLGESNGHVYGMLTAPLQADREVGGVKERLRYGLLQEGTWTLEENTPLPPESLLKLKPGDRITLQLGDLEAAGTGWGAFRIEDNAPGGHASEFLLGHFHEGDTWSFKHTGLDALDLTGALAVQQDSAEPTALKAEEGSVWIGARVQFPEKNEQGEVVARYDGSSDQVTNSWCTLRVANKCVEPLDQEHPAGVPDTILPDPSSGGDTPGGAPAEERVALALEPNSVDVFAHNVWRSILAPGHGPVPLPDEHRGGGGAFTALNEGWLGGENALGHWSAEAEAGSGSLVSWPLPDRSPLTSLALPPGEQAGASESGALAVGLSGTTMRYDAATGWRIEPVPSRAGHLNLRGVAFSGPSSAFAVGQFGVILRWDGSAWSEDPQSNSLTNQQLNAIALAPSGEGWAVGTGGTILHYDGHSWSVEQPPPGDGAVEITSVTVAGSEVFAVAGGNLIARSPDGSWHEVTEGLPSSPALSPGNLRLVAGLPDGGVVAAGRSVMLVREAPGESFQYAAQPLQGIAVALAPFRRADGKLRTLISIAPPVPAHLDVGGSPPGDGELMRQTDSGWQDLSSAQYAGGTVQADGAVKSDPVLALATNPSGEHLWAAGGYAGTEDAAGRGTTEPLQNKGRPSWYTASIWRYDSTGRVPPPAQASTTAPTIPAKAGTVSFAFFSSPACRAQCTAAVDAQPDANLRAAAGQIAEYAAQPGGPAFAMLGGNARGPEEGAAHPEDFSELPELLAPLGRLPAFAALGPKDSLPGREETRPWAEAFANAPAPFGPAPAAGGITPVSSGAPTPEGNVHRYYAFDTQQNGGTLRVIVLDNAQGSLEASAPGQMAWLRQRLNEAPPEKVPTVVVTALRLHSEPVRGSWSGTEPPDAEDGTAVASLLAKEGVLAVFTTNPSRLNEHYLVPETPGPGVPQIPEYEGASLGYQQPANNGVAWYFVSVNTGAREVHVSPVPVLDSLALKPLDGLSVARSGTLRFQAVGRRAQGTLATRALPPSEGYSDNFPGFDEYAEIPSQSCGEHCVTPSYSFTSSEPTIGDFVEATGEGSPFPRLNPSGHPIPSSTSGLFCAYNSGSTVVTITAGLLTYSLPVTVQAGGFGPPCGTVFRAGVNPVVKLPFAGSVMARPFGGVAAPPPPAPAAAPSSITPAISLPPPPPASAPTPAAPHPAPPSPSPPPPPAPAPPPQPQQPPTPARPAPPPAETAALLSEPLGVPPAIVPPATPPVEPIPPGAGGWAQSPSAAKRREESRKHASESAFTLRPASASSAESSGVEWFYVAVGIATLLALLLSARGMRPRSGARAALLLARGTDADGPEHRRRTDERQRRRPGA